MTADGERHLTVAPPPTGEREGAASDRRPADHRWGRSWPASQPIPAHAASFCRRRPPLESEWPRVSRRRMTRAAEELRARPHRESCAEWSRSRSSHVPRSLSGRSRTPQTPETERELIQKNTELIRKPNQKSENWRRNWIQK